MRKKLRGLTNTKWQKKKIAEKSEDGGEEIKEEMTVKYDKDDKKLMNLK